mmetsp:Transcript_16535/g.41274  ORF Transcript_16535/g.41274 Transcript_16535/m.41274 type:complete len:248 (-) Transcript_16535:195-938(-)|eukprot:CAMPEP_0202887136 /NCGR_PEP_ID=MMETSP1391-20130828/42527_1 /ASSEMBLY_ACC=CAM_ASM_000867 /TAXON_ID=1034604 /ORGANISM="Chlamydomonas leiostraca, Strain SAG 11-49" /LENGTH=247 /DNA_ID=CAMNT_0049570413 /DNA_START=141 /DNA_END=884 /DNA_ORIENTATION=-
MNLNRQQKEKVVQFRGVTGASEKVAVDCLKMCSWAIEPAIDHFYTAGLQAAVTALDSRAIESMFASYKDSDGDTITGESIMRFCDDLGVEPADPVMLVVAYHFNAATMGEFTREEFVGGCTKLGCDSMDKLRKKLGDLRAELKANFRDIYTYAYKFSCEKGQKCVQLDTAIGMWQLLLTGDLAWPLLDQWCEFLTQHHNRPISKDTWVQLLDFAKTIRPDFSNFDSENSAWPYLIDEFVDHVRESRS